MRIYKLASLIQGLSPSSPERERAAIREEISRFERVIDGLDFDAPQHNTFTNNPLLAVELQQLKERWSSHLKAALQLALKDGSQSIAVQEYLNQAEDFVARWDHLVQLMEHEAAARLETLRHRQVGFLVVFLGLMASAFVFLHRFVREPLKQLTAGADRLAAPAAMDRRRAVSVWRRPGSCRVPLPRCGRHKRCKSRRLRRAPRRG